MKQISFNTFFIGLIIVFLFSSQLIFTDGSNNDDRQPVGQNLIVFLVDGFGADLFNRTKELQGTKSLIENGAFVENLKPVFPPQSYPSWMSLSTGLYVENHNFTSDFMFDDTTGMLFQKDQGVNDSDYRWWPSAVAPFWYSVGKASIDVHCYWFAHCHKPHVDLIVQVPGARRHSFNSTTERDLLSHLPKIMKHVKKYQYYRQQLILLRYDGLEKALSMFEEGSSAALQAVSKVDTHIRRIQEEMESFDLFESTNLIVLSDHGLTKITTRFYIEECLADYSKIKQIVNSLAFVMIFPAKGEEDTIFFELKVCDQWAPIGDYETDEVPLVSVYRKSEIPERFHWKDSRFMSPIVLVTRPGVILLTKQLPSTDISERLGRDQKMATGWDNDLPEMQGIFMARGPAFKAGYKSEQKIEIVDIYQLVLNILGVEQGHPNNGSWERIEEFLEDGWESRSGGLSIRNVMSKLIFPIALFFTLFILSLDFL